MLSYVSVFVILKYKWVVYEVYIKGFIKFYFDVFKEYCGKFIGVVYLSVIKYFKVLGIIMV